MADNEEQGGNWLGIGLLALLGGAIIYDIIRGTSSSPSGPSSPPPPRRLDKQDVKEVVERIWSSFDFSDDTSDNIYNICNHIYDKKNFRNIKDFINIKDKIKGGAIKGLLFSKIGSINLEIYHLARGFGQELSFLNKDKIDIMVSFLYDECIQSTDKIVDFIKAPLKLTSINKYVKSTNSIIGANIDAVKYSFSFFAIKDAINAYFSSIYVDNSPQEMALLKMKEGYTEKLRSILLND